MAISVSEQDPFAELLETSMAESVTRHAQNPIEENHQFLLCGIDSLDLGLYINWGEQWAVIFKVLQDFKDMAQGTAGWLDELPTGRKYLHLPSGKPPNYRFHLQFPEYHLYIAKSPEARQSPNGYLSLNSEALWRHGVSGAIELALADLKLFRGEVDHLQISRVDLCADFLLPGGISFDFLRTHKVARSKVISNHSTGDHLETFYSGSPAAPIRLRFYDKGKEIQKKNRKLWFLDLWERDSLEDIWRVEFQLRRTALRQFNVNSLDDLRMKAAGIWGKLTDEWFSLRIPDNQKTERRTVHPIWQTVQMCAEKFGPQMAVERDFGGASLASATWYISHIAGCLPSFAARTGAGDFYEAMNHLENALAEKWFHRDFKSELQKRSIKLGRPLEIREESNEEN
jgi:hypothetical protein